LIDGFIAYREKGSENTICS